jgi:UDP-2,4-diacetamido-2,4,6-trideoxy-beta-L-altropyranose hydrolase
MPNNVLIRVDGGAQIGLGHVVRCIALAQMLKDEFQVHFIVKEIPESIIGNIISQGFEFTQIETEETFFKLLTGKEIVVLDNYFFDTAYQKRIKEISDCKLVCIDDLHDKEFYADLIINHAPGVKPEDYQAQSYTKFALGLDYVLLRPSFIEAAKSERKIDKIEKVFICFGGSDIKNLTSTCLNLLVDEKRFKKIIVVLGASFTYLEEVKKIAEISNVVELYHAISETKMLGLMKATDLAIVPSSGILLEAISAGCLVISGGYVENQKFIYQYYKDSNLIIDAGQFDVAAIKKAVSLSFTKKNIPCKIIDGLSGNRIVRLFFGLNINLRRIHKEDCKLLYNWANDPDVRNNAFNTTDISWENHSHWFLNRLNSPNTIIFILERNDTPIGQIRFDREYDYWKIDYSIDKKFRGMGMGSKIIKLGLEKMEGNIKAWVKLDNIASRKVFDNLGFKVINEENSVIEYFLITNRTS